MKWSLVRIGFVTIGCLLFAIILIKLIIPLSRYVSPYFWRVILPFILAILISYLLYPLLTVLTNILNMYKTSAIALIFITFFSLLFFFVYKGFPVLFSELEELSVQLPQLIALYEDTIFSIYESTSFLPEAIHERINAFIIELERSLEQSVERLMHRMIHSFDTIISLFIVPVLVFYMLRDFKGVEQLTELSIIPERQKQLIDRLLLAIHETFRTYIRGQMILSSFIFLLTYLLFYLIDLKYSIILSLIMGIMNVIPYFGPIIGTIPAIIVALSMSHYYVIYVIVIAIVVQLIESSLLSPYIMGKTARLHPLTIIFILLVSSELGGVIAMIVAIPLVMIIRAVFVSYRELKTAMH